jgi:hypothetical protein
METPISVESIVKSVALVPLPPGAVTVILPVVVLLDTTALRVVLFVTMKLAAGVPLNETALALVKLVPVIITLVPGRP